MKDIPACYELHHHISLQELVAYCQLAHEYKGKPDKVKVNPTIYNRIREVAKISASDTEFLGIKFLKR